MSIKIRVRKQKRKKVNYALAQSAEVIEYTNSISVEGRTHPQQVAFNNP